MEINSFSELHEFVISSTWVFKCIFLSTPFSHLFTPLFSFKVSSVVLHFIFGATQVTQHQNDPNSQLVDLQIKRPLAAGGSLAQLVNCQLLTVFSTEKRGNMVILYILHCNSIYSLIYLL